MEQLQKLFNESRQLYYKEDYDASLQKLKKYFSGLLGLSKEKARTELRFTAIVAMGRIYLEQKQDPDAAIDWFQKIEKSESLTLAEQDIITGWIAGAKDWKKLGKLPKDVKSEQELFDLGKSYYEKGLKKQKFTMDQAGYADLSIASTYLVPFIVNYDKNPNVGEALFMMGDIRRRLWTDNEYWSQNYYLAEAIRRFPGTSVATKSYQALEEDVHFGYSGSSGDHTPHSWILLLQDLKQLAYGKKSGIEVAPLPSNTPDIRRQ